MRKAPQNVTGKHQGKKVMPIIGSSQNYQNNISYGCFPQTIPQMNLTRFIYSLKT